jgi:hypothetical protein
MTNHLKGYFFVLALSLAACGGSDDAEEGGDGDGDSGGVEVCRCDNSATLGVCDEVIPKSDGQNIDTYCAATESGCDDPGGTYAEEACPSADSVGACFNDRDDKDDPIMLRRFFYSLGEMPFDEATAESSCDDEDVYEAP